MSKRGTIRFELRKDKIDRYNKSVIRLIYQVRGDRRYLSTKEKVLPANWDSLRQSPIFVDKREAKLKYSGIPVNYFSTLDEVKSIQNSLNELRQDILDIESRFILDKITFDSEMIIEKLRELKTPTTKRIKKISSVIDFIEKYVNDYIITRANGSLSVYKSLKNHIINYTLYTRNEITLENVDIDSFQSFQNFLIQCTSLKNVTIAKQLSTLKTILNYARKSGYNVNQKYKDFTIKRENLEVIALTREEFSLLWNFDFGKEKRLEQVKDVFCFSCATGLRYSDIKLLKRENIKKDEIKLVIKKTKETLSIPLNNYSRTILTKYSSSSNPLPIISNQKFNKYIKTICEKAGINEPIEKVRYKGSKRIETITPKYQLISSHVGRKTFTTLSLENGMSAEIVKSLTGHKDYKSFSRYINISESQKKLIMNNAWNTL